MVYGEEQKLPEGAYNQAFLDQYFAYKDYVIANWMIDEELMDTISEVLRKCREGSTTTTQGAAMIRSIIDTYVSEAR